MKKSVIREIFNQRRGTHDTVEFSEEAQELMGVVADAYDELTKELSPKQKELHDKFNNAREDAVCEAVERYFVKGFKLGLLVGVECMDE